MLKTGFKGSLAQAGALAALSLMLPLTAAAQYQGQVRTQLNAIQTVAESADFYRTHEYQIDRLPDDRGVAFTVTLREGIQYQIASVCDRDCTDLDLEIYDEHGNLIDADHEADDLPVVGVEPLWTGRFTIRVSMHACTSEPCYFGVGVFGKP
ncbi:MAG: hypothetical protein ABFS14_09240 [Gemmatimonadota bacterium]